MESINWSTVANAATLMALIVSIIVFIWQIVSNWNQVRYEKSSFHLAETIKAYEEAISMLSNGNNDRIIWIAAAKILARGKKISSQIVHKTHKEVFEVRLEMYRIHIGNILGYRNPRITGSFFYGAEDPTVPINEAEGASNAEQEYEGWTANIPRRIDESALYCIWKEAQFPEDYSDPLGGRFSNEEIQRGITRTMFPGMSQFLRHMRDSRN